MEENNKNPNSISIPPRPDSRTEFEKRKRLNPFIRFIIIGTWGALLAVAVFYGLRKMGY